MTRIRLATLTFTLATLACGAAPTLAPPASPTNQQVATATSGPPPTPTAVFGSLIGMGGYPLVTTEQVGSLQPGTRVRISSALFDGQGWLYQIVAMDERTIADARERQLAYAPDVTPGLTPTIPGVVQPPATSDASPVPTSGSTPVPTHTAGFASIAGDYACLGTEQGMIAGAGSLKVAEDGTFEYRDYYPNPIISGHLEWIGPDELIVVENIALVMVTITGPTSLHITLRDGSHVTHADRGYIDCTRNQP